MTQTPDMPKPKPDAGNAKTSTLRSTIANWLGQLATIVSGFILPRLLTDTLGPEELGVWDFGWTARSIIAMSSFGMGSSSNHHAAKFQSTGEWDALSRYLSATLAVVMFTAVIALILGVGVSMATPLLMQNQTAELIDAARIVVLAMAFASAMKMIQIVYGGTLAGLGRFDLLNLVQVIGDVVLVAALLATLLLGGGLRTMAACVAVNELLRWFAKQQVLRRLCPQVSIKPRWRDWDVFREVAGYGGKTMLFSMGEILGSQLVVAILMFYYGPVAVALFCRPRALVRLSTRFVMGYARVLVSQAGALSGQKNQQELARLLVQGTRNALYLALPIAAFFVVLGGPVLHVWMGEDYVEPTVLIVLVLGFLPAQVQRSTYQVLLGTGQHGWASLASLLAAGLSIALCMLLVGVFQWGVEGAAIASAVPIAVTNILFVPYFGCRAVGVGLGAYWMQSLWRPVASVLPFVFTLGIVRAIWPDAPLRSLGAGVLIAGPVLLITYWRYALPDHLKSKLREYVVPRRLHSSA